MTTDRNVSFYKTRYERYRGIEQRKSKVQIERYLFPCRNKNLVNFYMLYNYLTWPRTNRDTKVEWIFSALWDRVIHIHTHTFIAILYRRSGREIRERDRREIEGREKREERCRETVKRNIRYDTIRCRIFSINPCIVYIYRILETWTLM